MIVVAPGRAVAQAGITGEFHFRGFLEAAKKPANGSYDLQFYLYNSPTDGTLLGEVNTRFDVPVKKGHYSATLDFGLDAWMTGYPAWVEVHYRKRNSGDYKMSPERIQVLAVPYAMTAGRALTADSLTGGGNILHAQYAEEAGTAAHADHADSATTATYAGTAITAYSATEADTATTATYALNTLGVTIDPANVYHVAPSGGDYTTIGEAVEAASDPTVHKAIVIWPGVYNEAVLVTTDKTHLVGVSRRSCIIQYSIMAAWSSYPSAVMDVQGSDCSLRNLTIHNTATTAGQRAALRVGNSGGLPSLTGFRCFNCHLWAAQDTVWLQDNVVGGVLENCRIEGTTDVACSTGDWCVFRRCHVTGTGSWAAFWIAEKWPSLTGSSATIEDCTIGGCGSFAVILASSELRFHNNRYVPSFGSNEEPTILKVSKYGDNVTALEHSNNAGFGDLDETVAVDHEYALLSRGHYIGRFSGNGSGLTNVPDSALSSNVPLKNAANTFMASQTFPAVKISGSGKQGQATISSGTGSVSIGGSWSTTAAIVTTITGTDHSQGHGVYTVVTGAGTADILVHGNNLAASDLQINWRVID